MGFLGTLGTYGFIYFFGGEKGRFNFTYNISNLMLFSDPDIDSVNLISSHSIFTP